jgi:hypothetical protein
MKMMMRCLVLMFFGLVNLTWAQTQKHPSLNEYMMPQEAEIALAKSAAPSNISDRATIKLLKTSGYQVARKGDNGFVCMVMRGWSAPTYSKAQLREVVYGAQVGAAV